MACRGVHFAIDQEVVDELTKADEKDRVRVIQEVIEQAWDEEWLFETDKAWDAIHRCMTDGRLAWGKESDPMSNAILGFQVLYGQSDYIICMLPSEHVQAVADAISAIDEAGLCERYFKIDAADYAVNVDEEDFAYTWEYFSELPAFFAKAAQAGRSVIFTADQ